MTVVRYVKGFHPSEANEVINLPADPALTNLGVREIANKATDDLQGDANDSNLNDDWEKEKKKSLNYCE